MDRRLFLKILGASSVGSAAYGCGAGYERFFDLEEDMRAAVPITENYVNSICRLCSAGCSIRVRVANGDVLSITGNDLSPINRGNVCLRGVAGVQHLYSPNRIKNPMILKGAKGSGNFEELEWDEALEIVSERLQNLRNSGNPHKTALLSGYNRGLTNRLFESFFQSYGSPNYLMIDPNPGVRTVLELMHGERGGYMGYDLENSNYILNFGINLFESSASPVWHNWVYGYLRRERREGRAKLVHVAPMGNITAYKSDEWIRIRPGTGGALALGIANVLIRRNLLDKDFVNSQTFGFENWTDANGVQHSGFKDLVLDKYDTGSVSAITGVAIHTIEEIAREFAENRPAIALFDDSVAQVHGGFYTQMAVHALNALSGNVGSRGGVFVQHDPPYAEMPEIKNDSISIKGLSHQRVDRGRSEQYPFAGSVIQAHFYEHAENEIDTLFINDCNPLYTFSACGSYKEVFQKIPFVVNFSTFYDDTTPYCDLLLPSPTFFERWQDVPSGEQTGFNQTFGIMNPVVQPIYNTRTVEDLFLDLAGKLGPPVSDSLPWTTFEEMLHTGLRGIYSSGTGMIFSGVYGKSWLESLERSGWRFSPYDSFEDFWDQLVESGGWWNPFFPEVDKERQFKTRSGKFEFFCQELYDRLPGLTGGDDVIQGTSVSSASIDHSKKSDEAFLPHYEIPRYEGNPEEFPLILHLFETGALRDGSSDTMPSLLGVLDAGAGEKWDSWAEIDNATAMKYNIVHNSVVWIESPAGRLKTTIKITDRVVEGVVGIPLGLGHTVAEDVAAAIGVNPNTIIKPGFDRITGVETKSGVRVKIFNVTSRGRNA